MYAAFLGICDASILNFLLCHLKIDFLREHQSMPAKNSKTDEKRIRDFEAGMGCGNVMADIRELVRLLNKLDKAGGRW